MSTRHTCCALLLLLVAPAAQASGGFDVLYLPSATLGDSDVGIKGDGFSARLHGDTGRVAFRAEYTDVDYDAIEVGSKQLRGGLDVALGTPLVALGAEYIELEIDSDDFADGVGGHLTFALGRPGAVSGYLRAGYLWLEADDVSPDDESLEGFEYAVGAAVPLGGEIDGVLEFRSTQLENDDSGLELQLEETRVGLRVRFGKPARHVRRR